MIEQARLTDSPLGKGFEKNKTEDQRRKQIDAITNQDKRLTTLTNKNDNKDNYKKVIEEPFNPFKTDKTTANGNFRPCLKWKSQVNCQLSLPPG